MAFTGAFSGWKSSNRYGNFEPQRRRGAENFLFDRGWLNKSETIARGVLRPRDPSIGTVRIEAEYGVSG